MQKLKEHAGISFRSEWGWTVRWTLLSGGPNGGWHVERRIDGERQFTATSWPEQQARAIFHDGVLHDPVNPYRQPFP